MWFGLIGPLSAKHDRRDFAIPGARQRVLLASMLVQPGHVRTQDELAELVWDARPPAGAHVTLRSYVARLRSTLGPDAGSRIVTRFPGYLIEVSEDELDVAEFSSLCKVGAASMRASAWQEAADVLERALALWRGTPLVDVPCQALQQTEVPRLEELRLQALEDRIAANLHLGRNIEVIAELQRLARANPLRERLQALLMLALYRSGRQADALLVYNQTRRYLVAELGIEPACHLRALHHQILTQDPGLDVAQSAVSLV
jgi:DNA-binding SARP family transcriptional activator